jgi:glycosyltransferase involved in cell wall biosynthesis
VLIEHQHPAWEKAEHDGLYMRNDQYMNVDGQTYMRRKQNNFDLDKLNQKLLSILILGIPERIQQLDRVIKNLEKQIQDNDAKVQVEILALIDNKARTVGSKRQALLNSAEGRFVAYLDDDDTISENYIKELITAIRANLNVDVVSFNQETRIDNDPPNIVYFGLQYNNTEYRPGIPVYRKPFHMCAWNAKIAKSVSFKNISLTEDWTWIEELCKYAKTEHHIDKILHYYIYNSNTTTSTW